MECLNLVIVLDIKDEALSIAVAEFEESSCVAKVSLFSFVHFDGHLDHLGVCQGAFVSQIAQ